MIEFGVTAMKDDGYAPGILAGRSKVATWSENGRKEAVEITVRNARRINRAKQVTPGLLNLVNVEDPDAGSAADYQLPGELPEMVPPRDVGMTREVMERHSDALVLQSDALVANTAAIKDAANIQAAAMNANTIAVRDSARATAEATVEAARLAAESAIEAARLAAQSAIEAARVTAESSAQTTLTLHDREEHIRTRKTDAECRAIDRRSEAECRAIERQQAEGVALRTREVAASEQIAKSNFHLGDRQAYAADQNLASATLKRDAAQITKDRVLQNKRTRVGPIIDGQVQSHDQNTEWPKTCQVDGCNKKMKNSYSWGCHYGKRGKCPDDAVPAVPIEGPAHVAELHE